MSPLISEIFDLASDNPDSKFDIAREFPDMVWEFPVMACEFPDMAWEFPDISRMSQRTSDLGDSPRALFNFLIAPGIFLPWRPQTETAR